MNLAAELAENAAFTIVSLNDLCDRGVLCGPIRMKLYKQEGTALCGAPLHTGLAPPAFTAPCRNQTSVAIRQSQSLCPIDLRLFCGISINQRLSGVAGWSMHLQNWRGDNDYV